MSITHTTTRRGVLSTLGVIVGSGCLRLESEEEGNSGGPTSGQPAAGGGEPIPDGTAGPAMAACTPGELTTGEIVETRPVGETVVTGGYIKSFAGAGGPTSSIEIQSQPIGAGATDTRLPVSLAEPTEIPIGNDRPKCWQVTGEVTVDSFDIGEESGERLGISNATITLADDA